MPYYNTAQECTVQYTAQGYTAQGTKQQLHCGHFTLEMTRTLRCEPTTSIHIYTRPMPCRGPHAGVESNLKIQGHGQAKAAVLSLRGTG